jgi:hypothetical protein
MLLSAASILVPRSLRADWRREWEGEIWWWIVTQPGAAHTLAERLALAFHCAGAVSDGFSLWLDDEDRVVRLRAVLGGPGACLAAGLLLIGLIGVLSGGFANTRRSLQATFWPRNSELAILSQTSPFMGQRYGVPPLKVAYWDRHSASLQGAAVYTWYRSVIGGESSHTSDVLAAKVGVRFFSLLGTKPQMGRVFGADDDQSCLSCAVIEYDFWERRLGADPGIIGRTITVDDRPFRVIGVLPRDFWFLGERPAVWSLFDETRWRVFPIAMTGAICRLKSTVSPVVAEQELRSLARQVSPRESGTGVTVNPLDAIASRPITSLGPLFIAFAVLAVLCAVGFMVRNGVVSGAFLLAKILALLGVIFLAGLELSGTTVAAETAYCWLIVAGAFAVRWAWNDQRKRCRQCLGRLRLPVRIGEGSRRLLEASGTEMVCTRGHGVLFTTEGDSIAPKDRWDPLGATWCDLFAPVAKTTR